MASKRKHLSTLADPQPSSDEDETSSEEANDATEEEDDDGEEEEEANHAVEGTEKLSVEKETKSQEKKPPPIRVDPDEPESDSSSDLSPPSPSISGFTVKPIISKPVETDSVKSKKSAPRPSSRKHPVPEHNLCEKDPALKKKKTETIAAASLNVESKNGDEETPKKGLGNQRLWSSDDEIAILKGFIDYQAKKGVDPNADTAAFYEFVKKSLRPNISKVQLIEKVRRLKKKYQTNAEKSKKGEELVFPKPHESMAFDLSKKIWGGGNSNSNVKSNAIGANGSVKNKRRAKTSANNVDSPSGALASRQPEVAVDKGAIKDLANGPAGNGMKVDNEGEIRLLYPNIIESAEMVPVFGKSDLMMLGLIETPKAKELEEKWKKWKKQEIEVFLQRLQLIEEQTRLVLDAMN